MAAAKLLATGRDIVRRAFVGEFVALPSIPSEAPPHLHVVLLVVSSPLLAHEYTRWILITHGTRACSWTDHRPRSAARSTRRAPTRPTARSCN